MYAERYKTFSANKMYDVLKQALAISLVAKISCNLNSLGSSLVNIIFFGKLTRNQKTKFFLLI